MERYNNRSGKSGVIGFEIGDDFVIVKFTGNPRTYRYSYQGGAGKSNVDNMKRLARNGSGLNAYIKTHVDKLYDK